MFFFVTLHVTDDAEVVEAGDELVAVAEAVPSSDAEVLVAEEPGFEETELESESDDPLPETLATGPPGNSYTTPGL